MPLWHANAKLAPFIHDQTTHILGGRRPEPGGRFLSSRRCGESDLDMQEWPDRPKDREADYARGLFSADVRTQDWGLRGLREMGYVSVGCSVDDARRTVTRLKDSDGQEQFETREKSVHKTEAYRQSDAFEEAYDGQD